jgi:cysteine desulfurase/selenocysteine lyase
MPAVNKHEHELLVYGMSELKKIPGLHLIGTAADKASVLSFVLDGHSNDEVGARLNELGIAVRTGHHCAQPLMDRLGISGTVRASFALYNTREEIDVLVAGIQRVSKMF